MDEADRLTRSPESADPYPNLEIVFRGSHAACAEAALVLEAKGIAHEIAHTGAHWTIFTEPHHTASARDEIGRYSIERLTPRPRPAAVATFPGAGVGTAGFVIVLIAVAYCAGVHLFNADWLDVGSLDARSGGAGQWWRAVTALTLHLDQAHLLGNLLFGAVFGTLAGGAFGSGVAWASILVAGALADYLDMVISPPDHRSAGASTAVFAALGLLSGFSWRLRLSLREQFRYRWAPLFGGLFLLTLLGAGGEHVDVLAHALGFAVGLALGWIYARLGIPRSRAARPPRGPPPPDGARHRRVGLVPGARPIADPGRSTLRRKTAGWRSLWCRPSSTAPAGCCCR
jgi:membrane associated rhomboid family serine protease